MALGDIKILKEGVFGSAGPSPSPFAVAAGAVGSIKAGEPVSKALGAAVVTAMATNHPVVGTDFLAGIAMDTSTDTVAAAGVVNVMPLVPKTIYLIAPKVAATWDTQAEYDALVGKRVLIDLAAGVYTILAADGATSGCIVEPLDIKQYPGQVAFSVRAAVNYDA